MRERGLTGELIAEVFGTFILILLGDGVVANVGLSPRLGPQEYNWNTIVFGWAFAVIVAVFVVGGVSGAHINPAVTLALAVKRGFPWAKVVPYWVAQVLGAFLGALGVYLIYGEGLRAAGMPNVWCTGPGAIFGTAFQTTAGAPVGQYSIVAASITELIGTAVLMWGVLASGDSKNMGLVNNIGPFLVGGVVLAIGISLGGPSGYAINPARDFGPRLFGTLVGTQGLFEGLYWLVPPIIMTLIGGTVGAITYDWFVTPALVAKTAPESRTA